MGNIMSSSLSITEHTHQEVKQRQEEWRIDHSLFFPVCVEMIQHLLPHEHYTCSICL